MSTWQHRFLLGLFRADHGKGCFWKTLNCQSDLCLFAIFRIWGIHELCQSYPIRGRKFQQSQNWFLRILALGFSGIGLSSTGLRRLWSHRTFSCFVAAKYRPCCSYFRKLFLRGALPALDHQHHVSINLRSLRLSYQMFCWWARLGFGISGWSRGKPNHRRSLWFWPHIAYGDIRQPSFGGNLRLVLVKHINRSIVRLFCWAYRIFYCFICVCFWPTNQERLWQPFCWTDASFYLRDSA